MDSFKKFLAEGVYDPARHKAIFLLGGPGSGKSYVRDKVKGELGFKSVDPDTEFEKSMKKHGLDPKMPEHETAQRDAVRDASKRSTFKRAKHYAKGRLGMIIDGTGRDFDKVKRHSEALRKLGYETHAIFVNTSLHVAHKRNQSRERQVPHDVVEKSWHKVHDNIGKFHQHFGGEKFHIVDNDHPDEDLLHKVHKKVRKIADAPVTNPIAKAWEKRQLEKKNKLPK